MADLSSPLDEPAAQIRLWPRGRRGQLRDAQPQPLVQTHFRRVVKHASLQIPESPKWKCLTMTMILVMMAAATNATTPHSSQPIFSRVLAQHSLGLPLEFLPGLPRPSPWTLRRSSAPLSRSPLRESASGAPLPLPWLPLFGRAASHSPSRKAGSRIRDSSSPVTSTHFHCRRAYPLQRFGVRRWPRCGRQECPRSRA